MRETIFQSATEMPPFENSPDVVRVAQTAAEFHQQNLRPAFDRMYPAASVVNIERPRRGHGY
jgi:hypothetical protein